MPLKADDGTPLEVKEAIVLGPDKNESFTSASKSPKNEAFRHRVNRVRLFQPSKLLAPLLLLAFGGLLTVGAIFIVIFITIILGLWLIRRLFKGLKSTLD